MTDKADLVHKLVAEIGEHLSLRTIDYIHKHTGGSKAELLNAFLVFPEIDDFHASSIRTAIHAKQHFEEHISSEILDVVLNSIQLDDELALEFSLSVAPIFLGDDYEYELIVIKGSSIHCLNDGLNNLLNELSNEELEKSIKKVRNTTLINTLKGSR